MKTLLLAAIALLAITPVAQAQDGLYYGAGLAAIRSTSAPDGFGTYDTSGTDAGLALTLGYRFAGSDTLSFGVEGNLDVTSGNRMDRSCISTGPAWCDIDRTLRLRGTVTTTTGSGDFTAALGVVMIQGIAEDGPGTFVDATGRGLSLGLGWQGGAMPIRYDLNFDRITSDDTPNYDRSLDVIGLRVSYMF